MTDEPDVVGRLFAARVLVRKHPTSPATVGVAEIARYFGDPDFALSSEQVQRVFADPTLRETWRRVKSALARTALPVLAAASDRTLTDRPFPGGLIRLRRSKAPGQVYVLCRFQGAERPSLAFNLLIEGQDGTARRLSFPAPDADGQTAVILDEARPDDRVVLDLLADPRTEGHFAW